MRVEPADTEAGVYGLTLRIPEGGVEGVPAKGKRAVAGGTDPGGERAEFSSSLFTRKSEYTQTLGGLARLLDADLAEAERATTRSGRVEKLGAAGLAGFKALGDEVEADRLLLQVEKDEVLAAISRRAADWKSQVERAGKFSGVEIEPAFRPYLAANPLMMESTGAMVVEAGGGRRVVLAVASTARKDDSAADRLRAERVCRIKALASVVAERSGVRVAHTEEAKERTVVVIDKNQERATSVSEYLQTTKAHVEGVAKDMPVVGRWRSRDGTVSYFALGVVLDQNGRRVP